MKKIWMFLIGLLVPAGLLQAAAATDSYYNVKKYGAKGDGVTIDSQAINKAIDEAAAAGGGTVYFPAGKYASYSVRLRDNICLYFDFGATLYAARETETGKYDAAEENLYNGQNNAFQDYGHSHWKNSLIWGIDLNNISIVGYGLIDGTDGLTRGERGADKAIALKNCRNVTIKDITVLMGGHFAFLLTGVDNMTLDNIKVDSNRDGFDIDCCRNVRMSNCTVNCLQDDAIVLKSSFGLGEMRPCENITITNCQVSGWDMGTYLDGTYGTTQQLAPDRDGPTGRIKFGTESNAGFRNITISNCVFKRSRGLALETVDGAAIEDISISNITMEDICNSVIFLRLGNRARGPKDVIPYSTMKRVNISNIVAYNVDSRYSMLISGLPDHPIEDVTLSNIRVMYKGGLSLNDAIEQRNNNSFFQPRGGQRQQGQGGQQAQGGQRPQGQGAPQGMTPPQGSQQAQARPQGQPGQQGQARPQSYGPTGTAPARSDPFDVPEVETGYPEPSSFGILPASAMYIRHVKNFKISDVVMGFMEEDTRPAIVLKDVDGIEFRNIDIDKSEQAELFVLDEVKNMAVYNVKGYQAPAEPEPEPVAEPAKSGRKNRR